MFVLWWMSFHVTWLGRPVVTDVPTVKTKRASKAFLRSCSTSLPSRLLGRKAVRWVPSYLRPGFGCSWP